jgi:DNA-binding winged helix-turn-helix (wHTH) protein/tetratricopeptide (TPR) repeat protein
MRHVSKGQLFFAPFRLDPLNAQLWRGEHQINLRRKTFDVLLYLLDHPDQLVTKQTLLDAVWPGVTVSDSMPAVCVKELRKTLGDEAKIPRFIETVHGRGYRFVAKVACVTPAEAARKAAASVTANRPIMVGRENELARMRSYYSQVLEGQRKVVFIAGEAGIGKTAFARAFLDSIAEEGGARLGRGQCIEQYGAGEPFMPVLEALTRLGQDAGGERTVELLSSFAPTWLVQMSALLTPEQSARLHAQNQGVTQQRMLREMAQALEALTAEAPLVLLIEDLHWSDFSTLELISAVARRSEAARVLILGTYRPVEMLAHDHPLRTMKQELELHRYCEELRLKLLNEEDVRGYLTRRFSTNGSQRFARAASAIHKRTDGNPLFMVNVVDYLADAGILATSREAGPAEPARILLADHIEVPRSVRQMIERNLERLKPEEQAVLEGASVAGVEFSAVTVAAGLERPRSEVEACCAGLSRREQFVVGKDPIARPDGTVATNFRFLHALYQEVLYERVPIGKRAEIHLRLAETEEAAYGERASEIAAQLAHHFGRGGSSEKAIEYLSRAGEHAASNGADNEVIAQLDAALELVAKLQDDRVRRLQELRLRISIGPSLMAIQGLASSETAANYTRALELSQLTADTGALFEALSGLWTFHLVRAEHREAQALVQQLLGSARESNDDSHSAFAHFAAGNAAFWRGELEIAAKCLSRSIAACEPGHRFHQVFVDDPIVYSRAYAAWTKHYQGLPDQALTALSDCLRIARRQAHPRTLAMATQFAGHLYVFRREPDSILEHSRTLESLAGEHGFPFYQALAEILAGCAAVQRGQDGIEAIRRGLDAWQTLGSALAVPWFLGELADGLRALGRCDEALKVVNDALHQSERTGELQFAAELYRIAGAALMAQAKVVEAEDHFRRAVQVARTQGARMWQLRATTNLARLLDRQGKRAEARAMLAEIYGWFAEGFDIPDLKDAKTLLDQLSQEPTALRPSRKSRKNS